MTPLITELVEIMDFELIRQLVLSLEYILTISVAYLVTSTSDCGFQRPFIDHTMHVTDINS